MFQRCALSGRDSCPSLCAYIAPGWSFWLELLVQEQHPFRVSISISYSARATYHKRSKGHKAECSLSPALWRDVFLQGSLAASMMATYLPPPPPPPPPLPPPPPPEPMPEPWPLPKPLPESSPLACPTAVACSLLLTLPRPTELGCRPRLWAIWPQPMPDERLPSMSETLAGLSVASLAVAKFPARACWAGLLDAGAVEVEPVSVSPLVSSFVLYS